MWPAPMRSACGSTTYLCPARRMMTPHHGPAQEAVLPTAGHRIAHGLAVKGRDKTNLDNGILDNENLGGGILDHGIRPTGTISQHDAAMTAPRKARAINKDQTGRNLAVPQGPTVTTAPPEDAAARQAGQAGATVGGAHNIPNCYSRGGSHVPTLHF